MEMLGTYYEIERIEEGGRVLMLRSKAPVSSRAREVCLGTFIACGTLGFVAGFLFSVWAFSY